MRILILAANFITVPYPVYPLGASVIAESTRRLGHEVRLLDLLAENDFAGYDPEILRRAIEDFRPDCLGLSLRNLESADSGTELGGDSASTRPRRGNITVAAPAHCPNRGADEHWSLDLIRRIIADIRRISQAPVVLGGAGFSLMPEMVLKQTGADYGLAGEGEEIWPAFLEAFNQGRVAKGLRPRAKPGARQLNAYEPELVRRYAERGGLIGLQTKRGCPLNCLYCSYPLLEGRRIRPRPTEEVIDDIARLTSIIEKPHMAFADAVFNDPAGHWRELLQALVESGLKVSWTAFFQPTEFEMADFELIKASGASGLEFGTDGSNDAALRGLQKPFNFDLVRQIQDRCSAAGIPAAHYVIFGGPGETDETVEEGLENINGLNNCVAFISAGLSIYPDTPLFELARAEGLLNDYMDLGRPLFYYSPSIDPQRLHQRLASVFGSRRDRLYPPSRAIESTEALRRMGYRGILWDTLIGAGRRRGRMAANA